MDLILKMFKRARIFTWSWSFWENKVNLWHHDRALLWSLNENNSTKDLKLRKQESNENRSFLWENSLKCKELLSWLVLLSRLSLLMVTIELTSSECNFFSHKLHWLFDVCEPILSKNIVYIYMVKLS